jgi:hypothetical protein
MLSLRSRVPLGARRPSWVPEIPAHCRPLFGWLCKLTTKSIVRSLKYQMHYLQYNAKVPVLSIIPIFCSVLYLPLNTFAQFHQQSFNLKAGLNHIAFCTAVYSAATLSLNCCSVKLGTTVRPNFACEIRP